MKFQISKAELGFISDIIAGVETPHALLNFGKFVSVVSADIAAYRKQLDEMVASDKLRMEELSSKYLESNDGELSPKDGADMDEYQTKYTELVSEIMQTRNDAGNAMIEVEVDDVTFIRFRESFLNEVSLRSLKANLGIEQGKESDFISILYNVTNTLNDIQA